MSGITTAMLPTTSKTLTQKKKLAVKAITNAMKEDLSAKEAKKNLSAAERSTKKNVKNAAIREASQEETTTKEKTVNHSARSHLAIENLMESVLIVTKNVLVADAADTAARKTLNSTAHAPQAKYALTRGWALRSTRPESATSAIICTGRNIATGQFTQR